MINKKRTLLPLPEFSDSTSERFRLSGLAIFRCQNNIYGEQILFNKKLPQEDSNQESVSAFKELPNKWVRNTQIFIAFHAMRS
jgi:hypothetical protein